MKRLRVIKAVGALVIVCAGVLIPARPICAQSTWTQMALSPDGTKLAVSGRIHALDGETVHPIDILNAATGELLISMEDPSLHEINILDWSPDNTHLISSDVSGRITMWDITDGSHYLFYGRLGFVHNLRWNPAGSRIAASSGGAILIWDTPPGVVLSNGPVLPNLERLHLPVTVTGPISGIAWNSDGSRLALTGSGYVKIHDTTTTEWPVLTEFDSGYNVASIAWHPQDEVIAFSGSGGTFFLDANTWEIQATHPEGMAYIAWSPDGTQLAGVNYGEVQVWDIQTWQLEHEYSARLGVTNVAWSPDGTRLYYSGGPEECPYVNGVVLGSPSTDAGQD